MNIQRIFPKTMCCEVMIHCLTFSTLLFLKIENEYLRIFCQNLFDFFMQVGKKLSLTIFQLTIDMTDNVYNFIASRSMF